MDPVQAQKKVTVADVQKLTEPTTDFLCKLSDNTYGIKFGAFRMRDFESGFVIVDINDEEGEDEDGKSMENLTPEEEKNLRTVKYHLGPEFLELKTVGTTVQFSVGDKEVPNFRMIERHYFKKDLLQSFDFTFGFCIPNSKNSWEVIYQMPKLNQEQKQEIINSPWETKSDSFYFVNDQLIMHQKAEYNYNPE